VTLQAVFFDAGNTLLSLDYPAIVEALGTEGLVVSGEEVWRAECRARVRLDPFLAETETRESGEVFQRYMRYTCEELQIPWEPAVGRALARLDEMNRRLSLWRTPTPGARELLHELAARGYVVGVVSNSDGRVAALLRDAGPSTPLRVVVDSRVVGVEKPDPRIFGIALAQAGIPPEAAVYVGDFYSLDVVGARRAGLDAVLLDPVGAWPALDCPKIAALEDLPGLLVPSPDPRGRGSERVTPS
jgi:putative hydrolase of the HAD superfamily